MEDAPPHPGSPWYYFHPDGLGWLPRREAMGEPIYAQDVAQVAAANPLDHSDPRLASYLKRVADGAIVARRGRPRKDDYSLLVLLRIEYEDRLASIKDKQKRGELPKKLSSLRSPSMEAADEVCRAYRLGTAETLHNRFSDNKKQMADRIARSRAFFVNEKGLR